MEKKTIYTEVCYAFGVIALAIGTALMEAANFGMSMVVAPAYLVYLKLSGIYSFITFGMAEYIFQALLLLVMILVLKKFKVYYLLAFGTTILYGLLLDGSMRLVGLIAVDTIPIRAIFFLLGLLACSIGVAFLFHTYIPPEIYELFVKEISQKYGWKIHKCKTCYDCISCCIAILLSFLFFGFGKFEGVKLGTIFNALVNGWLIGRWSGLLEGMFEFRNAFRK